MKNDTFAKYEHISEYFENLSDGAAELIAPLIMSAVFLQEALTTLQDKISREGPASESLTTYNAIVRSYAQVVAKLLEFMEVNK